MAANGGVERGVVVAKETPFFPDVVADVVPDVGFADSAEVGVVALLAAFCCFWFLGLALAGECDLFVVLVLLFLMTGGGGGGKKCTLATLIAPARHTRGLMTVMKNRHK